MKDKFYSSKVIQRYEQMLATRKILYFDVSDIEIIINQYLDDGDPHSAMAALKLGLEQHPNNQSLLCLKTDILVDQNKLHQAEALLQQLLVMAPHDEDILFQLASVYSLLDNSTKCIEILNEIIYTSKDNTQYKYHLAVEYFKIEEFKKARLLFHEFLLYQPDDAKSLDLLVDCHLELDTIKVAISDVASILEENEEFEEGWEKLGLLFYMNDQIELAFAPIDRLIKLNPNNPDPYLFKAKLFKKQSLYIEAIQCYTSALKLKENADAIYRKIGNCYDAIGQKWLAYKFLSLPIRSGSQNSKCWIALLSFLVREKLFDKALHYIDEKLHYDHQNHKIWRFCIQIYGYHREKGQLYRAILVYLGKAPVKAKSWRYCAKMWIKLDEWKHAFELLLEATIYFPNDKKNESLFKICLRECDKRELLY